MGSPHDPHPGSEQEPPLGEWLPVLHSRALGNPGYRLPQVLIWEMWWGGGPGLQFCGGPVWSLGQEGAGEEEA